MATPYEDPYVDGPDAPEPEEDDLCPDCDEPLDECQCDADEYGNEDENEEDDEEEEDPDEDPDRGLQDPRIEREL